MALLSEGGRFLFEAQGRVARSRNWTLVAPPEMRITSLGNAVMQLGPRDDALGWTFDSLKLALTKNRVSDAVVLNALQARVRGTH